MISFLNTLEKSQAQHKNRKQIQAVKVSAKQEVRGLEKIEIWQI